MAVLDIIGTDVETGAETITGSYLVQSREVNDKDVDMEDIENENAARVSRLIKKRDEKITLDLILMTGADPATDFPVGAIAVHADFTNWFVDSAPLTKAGTAWRVRVSMTNIGITA